MQINSNSIRLVDKQCNNNQNELTVITQVKVNKISEKTRLIVVELESATGVSKDTNKIHPEIANTPRIPPPPNESVKDGFEKERDV